MHIHEKYYRNFSHFDKELFVAEFYSLANSDDVNCSMNNIINGYYGNPKSPNNLVARVTQKWRKDFEILKSRDSRTKIKFEKPKYWEKYIDLAQYLDQLGRKQELQNQFARRRSETTRQK